MNSKIRAVLLDLGGVVYEVDFNNMFACWSRYSGVSKATLKSRFRIDTYYRQHERGEIGLAAYFESQRAALGIDLSDALMQEGWNSIFVDEYPGVRKLLHRLSTRMPIYGFTNSNPTHRVCWEQVYAGTLTYFTHIFVSSDLGFRKPEAVAYRSIANKIGEDARNVLFFDDTLGNVDGARAIGMPAVHVKNYADLHRGIEQLFV